MFNRQCHGMTLIELLFALASSLFILLSLTTLYIIAQKNYVLQNALLSIEENASTTMNILQKNFQQAGNIGSAALSESFPIISFARYNLNVHNKISGDDHSITFRGASISAAGLIEKMITPSIIRISSKPRFSANDIAIISNHQHAEIFQVQNAYNSKNGNQFIRATKPLTRLYDETAAVRLLQINTFYTKKTTRINRAGLPIFALYLRDINNRHLEIVEDIQQLQISYDVLQDQHLRTLSAAQITHWENIVGIHIAFTVNHYPIIKHWNIYLA